MEGSIVGVTGVEPQTVVSVLLFGAGLPAVLAAIYLVALVIAAFRYQARTPDGAAVHRIVVLVPAHDESVLIRRCLDSLRTQDYPSQLFRTVVIADNCGDDTAGVATAAGAEVMVREDRALQGKGHALRWAMDRLLDDTAVDAVLVVDADSVCDRGMLAALEAQLRNGAEVIQAEYRVLEGSSAGVRAAAFRIFHGARFSGRAALGMPCNLVGNGMLFARGVLERHPWSAFTSAEDLEYSIDLRLCGVRPVFAPAAVVSGPAAGGGSSGRVQRHRWEGGRFHVARTRLPRLLAAALRRDLRLLDAAIDLAVPPLGLLVLLALVGAAAGAGLLVLGAIALWALLPWLLTLLLLPIYVGIGLRAVHAPLSAYLSLLQAPLFLLAKVGTYSRMLRSGLQEDRWERSERLLDPADPAGSPTLTVATPGVSSPDHERTEVGGVPIDVIDMDGAIRSIMQAVDRHRFMQVCTVNLHFLATARSNRDTRDTLRHSELNLADGAPVVWLSGLFGHRVPERVAGVDLVMRLMDAAAASGARVFLLGSENGTAAAAAQRLMDKHPGLVLAGVYEPRCVDLEQLGNEAIIERIHESCADILLVAMGHPKQELWINAHRQQLNVAVAIGVGCTLDIIAGRRHRAPVWMQRAGMEWLYRVAHEPRRLARRYATDFRMLFLVLLPAAVWHRVSLGRIVDDEQPVRQ
jgi:exopolysaccharide biosynthesis WecB/TagA/CpsF family protein